MAYTALTFVSGEVLTAVKMSLLAANDASFHDGTGIGDATIKASQIDFTTFVKLTPMHNSVIGDLAATNVTLPNTSTSCYFYINTHINNRAIYMITYYTQGNKPLSVDVLLAPTVDSTSFTMETAGVLHIKNNGVARGRLYRLDITQN